MILNASFYIYPAFYLKFVFFPGKFFLFYNNTFFILYFFLFFNFKIYYLLREVTPNFWGGGVPNFKRKSLSLIILFNSARMRQLNIK